MQTQPATWPMRCLLLCVLCSFWLKWLLQLQLQLGAGGCSRISSCSCSLILVMWLRALAN
jgi:hypothetical protein